MLLNGGKDKIFQFILVVKFNWKFFQHKQNKRRNIFCALNRRVLLLVSYKWWPVKKYHKVDFEKYFTNNFGPKVSDTKIYTEKDLLTYMQFHINTFKQICYYENCFLCVIICCTFLKGVTPCTFDICVTGMVIIVNISQQLFHLQVLI